MGQRSNGFAGIHNNFIISEILGHHNQGWSWNLHFKLLQSSFLKKLIALGKFCTNTTGCVEVKKY